MNNTNSLSKKDFRQDEEIPRLIHENSPANILKSARESLKNLDSNKPFRTHKRPHPQLKLPQTSSCLEEVATAKLRPSVNNEPVDIPDRLRAKSAFDSRMSHLEGNFFKGSQEQTKKFTFNAEKDKKPHGLTIDVNSANAGDNTDQKTPKLFIIKHKKNGSRKELDNDNTKPIPSVYSPSSKSSHVPQRFSSFKSDTKTFDMQGNTIEEKKSESFSDAARSMTSVSSRNGESRGSNRPLSKFASSRAGSRISSRVDIQGRDSEGNEDKDEKQSDKHSEEPPQETQSKRNSIILKKDEQIEFNVKLGEVLGEGAYGIVYKAYNLDTGQFLAAKHIKLAELQNKSSVGLENFCHEIEVYQKLEHKNIVLYLGAKQEDEDLYIYMEYMPGGSISSMLKQYGAFQESVIRKFTGQVVQGLHYLHQKGVIHRDIKGGNILSDGSGNVKLADFGASKHIENISLVSSVTSSEVCNSVKGSLFWMAPELMNNEKHGRKIDIWSLGCTVIEMASGKHPWPDVKGFPELIVAVMTKKCPPIPEYLSDTAKDFIKQCCQFDKKLRPRTDKLLLHPFLAGHVSG